MKKKKLITFCKLNVQWGTVGTLFGLQTCARSVCLTHKSLFHHQTKFFMSLSKSVVYTVHMCVHNRIWRWKCQTLDHMIKGYRVYNNESLTSTSFPPFIWLNVESEWKQGFTVINTSMFFSHLIVGSWKCLQLSTYIITLPNHCIYIYRIIFFFSKHQNATYTYLHLHKPWLKSF